MKLAQELVLLSVGLHIVAFALVCVLFWMLLRSNTASSHDGSDDEDEGGGGGNDRLREPPKPPKPGGIPLPDADQSAERFRAPGRLAERHPFPVRRPEPAHEPERQPERV
ncbi:MAG: hypothetical protein ACR2NB_02940 [Solirubrobacteraceae bacterium]